MKLTNLILPGAALGAAAVLLVPVEETRAYTIIHGGLGIGQRDFRVFNNFTDGAANNNNVANVNYPNATGAVMALWKGSIEWQSSIHGDGGGDPTQPSGLGSGGANFDPSYQGLHNGIGGINDNVISAISSCGGTGTLAYTESPGSNGWRIRFCDEWVWDDGPGGIGFNNFDLQGVQCHEYGHALGLGHSNVNSATMFASTTSGVTGPRSIAPDDINGIKAIYGAASPTKPKIDSICIGGGQITVTGQNFAATGNTLWLTNANLNNGTAVKVFNLTSNGTDIVATIPANAGPGDILVQNAGGTNANLSNAFPTDLQPTGGSCGSSCPTPTAYCTTSPNSVGNGMFMGYAGSQSVAAEDFVLSAFGGPPGQLGIFYYGENQANTPFGEGVRCVGPGILGTFRLPVISIDNFGDATFPLDWSTAPVGSGPGQIASGTSWNFQFWYRDPAGGGTGFNLSDGLNVAFCP